MKKLSKLKLNDFHEMSEIEMKNVVGGSGSSGAPKENCKDSCDGSTCWINDSLHTGTCQKYQLNGTTICACSQ